MKLTILFVLIGVATVLAAPKSKAKPFYLEYCDKLKCKLPGCQCSSKESPVGQKNPQFVLMSFTDAAAELIFDSMWEKILFEGKNPDGCPISATFFVPHEYSNYRIVNKLYNNGFEIASHSITKTGLVDYWQTATKELIVQEMGGQRALVSKFANIPKDEIIGARIPLLQINNQTLEALQEAGFHYDASWPTRQENPFFPYTLDYSSDQICQIARECFTEPIKGFWEIPIIDLRSQHGIACNSLLGCSTEGSADEIFNWMKENFEVIYKNQQSNGKPASRAPFSLVVDYAWFSMDEDHQGAFKKFMEYLKENKDVYIVSHRQALNWARNPSTEFKSCQEVKPADCAINNCKWKQGDSEKYMVSCVACPENYPWLNNPLGR